MPNRFTAVSLCCCLVALAVVALPAAAQAPAPSPICLYAFSKDVCGLRLFGGTWGTPACVPGAPNCTNLVGSNATFRGSWASSAGSCNGAPCDEAPDFGDLLDARVDVRSQRHTTCQARGSYDGDFKIIDSSSNTTIASGNLVATLGVGTHRDTCSGTCTTAVCEKCWDARVATSQYDWEVGSEGTLRGSVIAGPYAGCTFTASYQGDFITDGDSRGPLPPNASWGFCGALEGVLECACGLVP
jgi:hypothetical protein